LHLRFVGDSLSCKRGRRPLVRERTRAGMRMREKINKTDFTRSRIRGGKKSGLRAKKRFNFGQKGRELRKVS